MRNLMNLVRAFLVVGALAFSACSSSSGTTGTGGSTGAGGSTGSGGSNSDGGSDAPLGTDGGAGVGGGTGTGGAGGISAHQLHLNLINGQTTGGVPVTRQPPVLEDTCI